MNHHETQPMVDERRTPEAMAALDAARQAYHDARTRVDEQAPDAMAALDDAMRRYERAVALTLDPNSGSASPLTPRTIGAARAGAWLHPEGEEPASDPAKDAAHSG